VDIISAINLAGMAHAHAEKGALATLAVQGRESSRYLLFDDALHLCGRRLVREARTEMARPSLPVKELAFCGIHIISPRLLTLMTETGVFSIIDVYLRLAAQSEKILGFRADGCYWCDLGKPEQIAAAAEDLKGPLKSGE
jgi:NDP-sugar pyrophosphorylase family protein